MNKTVGISISEEMLEDITGLAHDLRISRSLLVCTAIEELLAKYTKIPLLSEPSSNTLTAFFRNREALETVEINRVLRWLYKLDPDLDIEHPFKSTVYSTLHDKYGVVKEYVHPEDVIDETKVNSLLRTYSPDSITNPWERDNLTRAESIWLFTECSKKRAGWEGGANRVGQS